MPCFKQYVNVVYEKEEMDVAALGATVNLADASVYPSSVVIHDRVVDWIARLWHCPEPPAVKDLAMGLCMDELGLGDAASTACDVCIRAAATAAAANSVTCDVLAGGSSGLCTALVACPTCPAECAVEAQDYALCEVNEELGSDCTTITCAAQATEP